MENNNIDYSMLTFKISERNTGFRRLMDITIKNKKFWYILIILLVLLKIVDKINYENMMSKNDMMEYSNLNYAVIEAIKIDPSIAEFKNNEAIIKMDVLYGEITNGEETMQNDIVLDKHFNECSGYVIVTQIQDDYEVDTTHVCDIVDD